MSGFELFNSNSTPSPVGPYSTGVLLENGFLFLSGQISISNTGEIIGENTKEQTQNILENIKKILAEKNYTIQDIIKCTVYLKNINDFKYMNEVYEKFFNGHKPIRTTIEVSNLPKNALVEIEVICFRDGGMK
ncbi:MAG: Rid family detoxifying hydrolase [Brevinematales bacterium]|nr:Rid family detoxifying hydrolase [Brevinematales bacterium]